MATKKAAKELSLEGSRTRVMPTPFGIRVDFPTAKRLASGDVKKALIAAVEAIPATQLRNFTNGRITMIV